MTTTAVAASTRRASDLLLLRLLTVGKSHPGPARLRAELSRLLPDPVGEDRWRGLLDELQGAGLVAARPLRLTDTGKSHALRLLGLTELPPRTNWRALKYRFLVPLALDVCPEAGNTREKIRDAEGLAAFLLKRHFDLPSATGLTLAAAAEAVACKELGFPGETRLKVVAERVLARLLGETERSDPQRLRRQLARQVVDARSTDADSLREAVLRNWVTDAPPAGGAVNGPTGGPAPLLPPKRMELSEFAAVVGTLARTCPTGRFGDNKVFISHAWRQLRNEPNLPPMGLEQFKEQLVESNRKGLVQLSRADLVESMDPADVRESETSYLTGLFHFILVPEVRP